MELAPCLIPIATLLLTSCGLCRVEPERLEKGALYVIPEWDTGPSTTGDASLAVYLAWSKGDRDEFSDKLIARVRDAFGTDFPTVPLDDHEEFAIALGLLGEGEQEDLFTTMRGWNTGAAKKLRKASEDIGRSIETVVQQVAPQLTVFNGGRPAAREISYIDKGDVTYCVYGAYVYEPEADDMSGTADPRRWEVSHTGDVNGVAKTATAWLALYVVVSELPPGAR